MKKSIKSHYTSIRKEAFCLLGIAFINLILAFFAFMYWEEVGLGILITLSAFSTYQLVSAAKVLLNKKYHASHKTEQFNQKPTLFVNTEKQILNEQDSIYDKLKNTFIILFLTGILCLLMGAFSNWGDMSLGIGASLALQASIMLTINLLADFRNSYYQQRLKKFVH